MWFIEEEILAPVMIFAIPIVAIAGGILAGIIKTVSSHRLMEVAIRERMALVARGVDPDKIPGTLGLAYGPAPLAAVERFRAQGLMVAGFVTAIGGAAVVLIDGWFSGWEVGDGWPVGVIALAIGLALLLSGLVIWPRGRQAQG